MRFAFTMALLVAFFMPTFSQTPASPPLRVLSWNIYMLPRFVKITGKRKRATEIGHLLRKSPYDVLVLQESFLGTARKRIRNELVQLYPEECGPANLKFSLKANSGIWILSRLPMKCLEEIDFSECQGLDDCMARKGALLVEVNWKNQPIQVLGTHLQAGGPQSIRHSQYAEIRALLNRHQQEKVLQIVCGDMNTRRSDLSAYEDMLRSLDVEDGPFEGPRQFTSDAVNNDIKPGGSNRRSVIDYIFIRRHGLKVNTLRRWIPTIEAKWSQQHRSLSDHHPVAIELAF